MRIALYAKMSLLKLSLQQFINVPGLKALGLIFTNPTYLIPDFHLDNLGQLDFQKLKKDLKVECLVFDKDNTLSYCFVDEPHPSVVPSIATAAELFPKGVAILSNSAGTLDDDNYKMAIASEQAIGLPVIRHRVKKPGCLPEVLQHFERELNKSISPEQICVIGDRLMTDIVFANQYGMKSVLVEPLTYVRDHPAAVIIRILEIRILLPLIRLFLRSIGSKRPNKPEFPPQINK
jgi:phosphatidylglycerophosphatase GEP4